MYVWPVFPLNMSERSFDRWGESLCIIFDSLLSCGGLTDRNGTEPLLSISSVLRNLYAIICKVCGAFLACAKAMIMKFAI